MAWIELMIAGVFEVVWATAMKLSNGLTKMNYTVATVVGMIISFLLLARATKSLPLSLAYPIWTGVGAVGSIVVGVLFFGDKIPLATWFFVALLLIGIIGIKVTVGD
ncbi:DMT family transporter [Furfurilactobacillus rossiae]|uniref:Uncharacterized protein n=1 Tax=Furfurilactobacillus rossiae DSM 15814 TaxID=1114972 RepID=A0A0R1RAJ8_9LACO|nr:multidrug efflux SMR transporter [Furfurilactobacillus rossiae]KRL53705.1 hypothetical protein FD35_GL000957 [Furfurilactobacillus rossiae DSM 15814]QFR67697.1 QacE family quaternary ammonium compound efflux SMR transporter [Furfurilactobacillus rossiae]QLE60663.1 Quaternary ammonium compound-resistance protein sugE [Furfurilactobacillus rossiae]